MTSFDVPTEVPSKTPRGGRVLYGVLFLIVATLGLLAYGFAKIPEIRDNGAAACRALLLCSPPPLKPMQRLSANGGSGSTWESVSAAQLDRYSRENPDWDIDLVREQEPQSKDGLGTPRYHFDGHFEGKPHWRGLLTYLGLDV